MGDRVRFEGADLVPPGTIEWDLVLANLPYVRGDAMADLPRATTFEPAIALDGGVDGLAVIGRLLDLLPTSLSTIDEMTCNVRVIADNADELRMQAP